MQKTRVKEMAQNLLHNWFLPLGAAAYFCTMVRWDLGYGAVPEGIGIAFLIWLVIAAMTPPVLNRVWQMPWWLKTFAAVSAVGAFWDPMARDLGGVSFAKEADFLGVLAEGLRLPSLAVECIVALAVFFAFVWFALFLEKLIQTVMDSRLFAGISLWEWAAYGCVLFIGAMYIAIVYSKTGAFYGAGGLQAQIYSTDSFLLVPSGAYVSLLHNQNGIRQPLFVVFSAPLMGYAYSLGALLYRWPSAQMMLLGFSQLLLIVLGTIIMVRILNLSPVMRVCVLSLFCCTYSCLLFTLVLEQYAVAFFWLMLCLYMIWCRRPTLLAVLGAGGSVLTSLAWVPLAQEKDIRKDFRGWFLGCARQAAAYLLLMLAFCRLSVILDMERNLTSIRSHSGLSLSLWDRILQYLAFVRNCFLAPESQILLDASSSAWWQMPVTSVNATGLILLALTLLSLWLNRKKRSSLLCGYWVAFSVFVLVIVGWGTAENGLILYALYFGWAYFALLCQLVQWIGEKLGLGWLIPAVSAAAAAVMLSVNIPDLAAMVGFAATYCPG